MERPARKQLNDQLVRWLRERAAGAFAGELSLVVSYGSHWNGTAGPLSDVDCYFVPKTERGQEFGGQFILQGVGYDIFPMSWERLGNIARLEESLAPLVGGRPSPVLWGRGGPDAVSSAGAGIAAVPAR